MTRPLTIVSVAYALAPVSEDTAGGAEQILAALDSAWTRSGHRSIVVAGGASRVAGEWADTGVGPDAAATEAGREAARAAVRETLLAVLARERVDLVHLHGLDFAAVLPEVRPPALVTLHLPPAWYEPGLTSFAGAQRLWFNCVSETQRRACPPDLPMLPVVENGVDIDRLRPGTGALRSWALMLGRVCPEKGQHLALEAARLADVPLVAAGEVFPYPEHRRYFAERVRPLLDRRRRFVGALPFARKRRFLRAACCLLVPSSCEETSSLVSMEALACGTPVIASPRGALPEIVAHGVTGFLPGGVAEMAEAIGRAGAICRDRCRREARTRFDVNRMAAAYQDRYTSILAQARA